MSLLDNLEDPRNISLITSASQLKKRSSYETIFNIANTMMGTALLVMPCHFYTSGIISSILASLVMVAVSYWTCNTVIIHSRDDEYDYPLAIRRLLGETWEKVFNFVSFLLLLLVCIIHFILMANILYSIIINISSSTEGWPKFDEIDFSRFSMQYVGIILFFLCGALYSLDSIRKLLILNDKGIYMILLFSLYIGYLGISALATTDLTFIMSGTPGKNNKGLEIVLFDSNLTQLVGVFSLAYFMHNAVTGMMKSNKDPTKNSRDLLIAYIIVFVKYSILGIFGCFAVAALYNDNYEKKLPANIMELLTARGTNFLTSGKRIVGMIALFFVFVQLTTVLPILNFFTRRQFFGLILSTDLENVSKAKIHCFNIVFNLICLGFEIPVFEPSIVIAYTGAVGGFVLIYVIPIYCHLKCMYSCKDEGSISIVVDDKSPNASLIEGEGEVAVANMSGEHNNSKETSKSINFSGGSKVKLFGLDESKVNELVNKDEQICRTDYTHETRHNKIVVYTFYSLLVLFGFAVFVVSIYVNIHG